MKNVLGFLLGLVVALAIIVGIEFSNVGPRSGGGTAIESVPSLDPRAIVVLEFVEQNPGTGFGIRWPAVAFAVGDGTLLLTAAHCIADIENRDGPTESTDIVAISPYYGDLFALETVAIDWQADLAILQAPWPAHPALSLATADELAAATEMLIVSRPQAKQISPQIHTERLPLLRTIGGLPNQAIQLKGTRLVAQGWSGSPLVLRDSGAVAGIATQLRTQKSRRFRFWNVIRRDALGCAVDSIHALLHDHGLDAVAGQQPADLKPIPDADRGFRLAMDCFETLHRRADHAPLEAAEELIRLRPGSVQGHLLAAYVAIACASEPNVPRSQLLEQAESSYLKALEADPNDAHAHAVFSNFLATRGQESASIAQAETALALDPNDRLAQINRLRLLPYAQARDVARQLLERDPKDAYGWFYYAFALLQLHEPQEALDAVQRAVDLDPDGLFYGIVAEALTALGRLDEADENYRLMTERCSCQRCWYRYAAFLTDHRPDRLDEAQHALGEAEAKGDVQRRVSQGDMETLKFRLLEKAAPEEGEALARERLDAEPENARTWWHLASILRAQEKFPEAAEAAAKAVALDPNAAYRPRLANCLAKTGDLDAAQRTYDEMLDKHAERERYWYWYAEFLLDCCPDRIAEAQNALERAEGKADTAWSVPAAELAELKARLDSVAAVAQ